MRLDRYDSSDSSWDEQLCDLSHDVYHLRQYIVAEDAFRGSRSFCYVVSDDDYKLVVPLTRREIPDSDGLYDVTSPYGYPAPIASEAAPDEWIRFALNFLIDLLSNDGCVSIFLRYHPLIGISPDLLGELGTTVNHGDTVSIRLGREFDEIRAEMRKTNRYEIRKALREGQIAALDEQWNHFEDFLSIYTATMKRLEAGQGYFFSRDYFESLRNSLPGNVFLWTTKIDGQVAAVSLITECTGITQYHLSGTHPEFQRQFPTKVLLDAVAAWSNARGNTHFHLGGGLGGEEDSLFRFKAGFGNERHPFWTARIVSNREAYERLTATRSLNSVSESDSESGFFPAYRKP